MLTILDLFPGIIFYIMIVGKNCAVIIISEDMLIKLSSSPAWHRYVFISAQDGLSSEHQRQVFVSSSPGGGLKVIQRHCRWYQQWTELTL